MPGRPADRVFSTEALHNRSATTVHTIRLHAAWDAPSAIIGRRRFHTPSGLEPRERVWLVLAAAGADARVMLNDHELSAREAPRWEVRSLLHKDRSNELLVESDTLEVAEFAQGARLEIGTATDGMNDL